MPYIPWRETLAWIDHAVLPEPGGLRQQPMLLWMTMEALADGIISQRNARRKDAEEALIARLSMK